MNSEVDFKVTDESQAPIITTPSGQLTSTELFPIFGDGPKGMRTFSGLTAYADCVAVYGKANSKKFGPMYKRALDHLQAGGNAVIVNQGYPIEYMDPEIQNKYKPAPPSSGGLDMGLAGFGTTRLQPTHHYIQFYQAFDGSINVLSPDIDSTSTLLPISLKAKINRVLQYTLPNVTILGGFPSGQTTEVDSSGRDTTTNLYNVGVFSTCAIKTDVKVLAIMEIPPLYAYNSASSGIIDVSSDANLQESLPEGFVVVYEDTLNNNVVIKMGNVYSPSTGNADFHVEDIILPKLFDMTGDHIQSLHRLNSLVFALVKNNNGKTRFETLYKDANDNRYDNTFLLSDTPTDIFAVLTTNSIDYTSVTRQNRPISIDDWYFYRQMNVDNQQDVPVIKTAAANLLQSDMMSIMSCTVITTDRFYYVYEDLSDHSIDADWYDNDDPQYVGDELRYVMASLKPRMNPINVDDDDKLIEWTYIYTTPEGLLMNDHDDTDPNQALSFLGSTGLIGTLTSTIVLTKTDNTYKVDIIQDGKPEVVTHTDIIDIGIVNVVLPDNDNFIEKTIDAQSEYYPGQVYNVGDMGDVIFLVNRYGAVETITNIVPLESIKQDLNQQDLNQ